ncbi:unnamed protein product [Tenebrio molitor]|nr:unnamed protein product [Tenebrio molitor]
MQWTSYIPRNTVTVLLSFYLLFTLWSYGTEEDSHKLILTDVKERRNVTLRNARITYLKGITSRCLHDCVTVLRYVLQDNSNLGKLT